MLKNIACDAYLNLIDRGSACSRIFGMLLNFKQGGQYLPECQYRYFIIRAIILVKGGQHAPDYPNFESNPYKLTQLL